MEDPVRGIAQVVSVSMNRGRGVLQMCTLQLVVQAEGLAPTAVAYRGLIERERWPMPGMVLPVTVDRSHPQAIAIDWDEVPVSSEGSRRAAELSDEPESHTVLDLSEGPLRLTDEQKAKLRTLGIDPESLTIAAREARSSGEGNDEPTLRVPDDPMDERLERLERLARLREQGILTLDEFEAQKREILRR
jgi:hypothetical protein